MNKNYTKIPNELLGSSQLSLSERYLMCVLLKHCGQDDYCYPSQQTMAGTLGYSGSRHIRNLLSKLENAGLISKKRMGFNKPNTYKVVKDLIREYDRNSNSYQLRSKIPVNQGSPFPPNMTYRKRKDNIKEFNSLKEKVYKLGIKRGLA